MNAVTLYVILLLAALMALTAHAVWQAHKAAPTPIAITMIAPQCSFVRDKTIEECRQQYENRYYDAGAENYPREEKKIGIALCARVGEAAFFACTSGDAK